MRDAQSFGQQIARGRNAGKVLRGTVFEAGSGTAGVELADGVRLRRVPTTGALAVGDVVDIELSNGSARVLTAGEASGGSLTAIGGGVGGTLTGAPSPHDLLGSHHTLPTLAANLLLGSPYAASGVPSFRALGVNDLPAMTIGAGAGLTGGGDIRSNPTLNVIAGNGITVNADDVAVNQAYAFNWTNQHIFTRTAEQIRLAYDVSHYTSLTTGSGGNFTVAPTGDFLFDPVGNDILPVTNYDLNLGSLQKKYLTLHAAELWVETLVAQDTIATIGGRVLVTPTTQLTRDLSNSAGTESTITQRGSATSANGSSSAAGIAYVASSTVKLTGGTAVTVNVPAGTLAGHVMIAGVEYWEGGVDITAPGGWTLLQTLGDAGGEQLSIYYKVAGSSEPSNYTWTLSSTEDAVAFIATYSGVDTAAPIDTSAIELNSSSTSAAQTAITTGVANAMLLYIAGLGGVGVASVSATPPSGMTERVDNAQNVKFIYLADVLQASAGTTGTKTATLSSAYANVTALVSLKPASSTTQAAVSKPTGVTTGDLLLFTAADSNAAAVLSIPTGLTLITSASSSAGVVRYYYKIAGASEPSTYTFGLNTTDNLSVSCVAYYNVDTSTPVEAFSTVSGRSSTSMTATSIASTSTTARLIFSGAAIDSSAGSITATAPSGMTELIDAGTGAVRIYLAHVALSSAGLTGDKTATLSSAKAFIIGLFALRPAVTGGTNTIYVKHNQMQAGDVIYMQANGRVEFMSINSAPTTVTAGAEYSYTVTRNLDGTGANTWSAGDALANTGTPGSGFIDLYSLESIKGIPFDYLFNFNPTGSVYSANLAQESSWAMWDASTIGANHAIYYGCESTPFSAIFHYIQQIKIASGDASAVEYWNGSAWTAVVGLTLGGNASFGVAGITSLSWSIPAQTGWAKTTINGVSAYWVRNRITAGTWTQIPQQGSRRVYRDKNTWGPTIAGMVRASTTFNDVRERWAIGNLNGLYDYGLNTYGAAFGDPLASWLSADANNGIRIMNGSIKLAGWDIGGNLSVGSTSNRHIYIGSAGDLDVKNGDTVLARFGANLYGVPDVTAAFNGIALFKDDALFNDTSASYTTKINNTGVDLYEFYRSSGSSGIQYVPLGGSFKLSGVDELGEFYVGRIYHDINYALGAVEAGMVIDATLEKSTMKPIGVSAVAMTSKLVLRSTTTEITGSLTVDGALSAGSMPNGVNVPRSSGSAVFAIDGSGTGSAITLSTNATATPFGNSSNFSGLILINETAYNGINAVFLCAGGVTTLLAESAAGYYSTAQGTASKANVYYNSNVLTLENKQTAGGGSRTFNVVAIRSRASS